MMKSAPWISLLVFLLGLPAIIWLATLFTVQDVMFYGTREHVVRIEKNYSTMRTEPRQVFRPARAAGTHSDVESTVLIAWSRPAGDPALEICPGWTPARSVGDQWCEGNTIDAGTGTSGTQTGNAQVDVDPQAAGGWGVAFVYQGEAWWVQGGGKPAPLTAFEDVQQALLSPQGDVLAFTRKGTGGELTVWTVATEGGEPQPLAPELEWTGALALHAFGEDGRSLLLLARDASGEYRLWSIALDGSQLQDLGPTGLAIGG